MTQRNSWRAALEDDVKRKIEPGSIVLSTCDLGAVKLVLLDEDLTEIVRMETIFEAAGPSDALRNFELSVSLEEMVDKLVEDCGAEYLNAWAARFDAAAAKIRKAVAEETATT